MPEEKKVSKDSDDLSLLLDDELKNLSDVGATLGYGRTRFYQWCRGRGLLTPMNTPSIEMISAVYMVTALSDTGYPRVYVTHDGVNYVGNLFETDIQKGMIKL